MRLGLGLGLGSGLGLDLGLGFSLGVGVGLGLELGPGLEPTLMTMVSSMKAKISLMGVSSNVCVGLGDS